MISPLERYGNFRPMLNTGDLLLWQTKGILGWLIRKFSGSDVNHAGLVLRLKEYEELKGRRWTLEALEHGIVLRLISERLTKYEGRVWHYPLKPEFEPFRAKIGAIALDFVGRPYDYQSLIDQAISRVSTDAKKFFCSEYVYFCLKEAGLPGRCDKAPRPGDLLDDLDWWQQPGNLIYENV